MFSYYFLAGRKVLKRKSCNEPRKYVVVAVLFIFFFFTIITIWKKPIHKTFNFLSLFARETEKEYSDTVNRNVLTRNAFFFFSIRFNLFRYKRRLTGCCGCCCGCCSIAYTFCHNLIKRISKKLITVLLSERDKVIFYFFLRYVYSSM